MIKIYLWRVAAAALVVFLSVVANAQTVGLITHTAGSNDDGYVLFTPQVNSDTTYLIDKCGRLVHKWPGNYTPGLDAYLLPDGSLLRAGHYPNPVFDVSQGSAGGIIQRYDWDGNLTWNYVVSDTTQVQNHDIYPMPNGNVLVAVWEVIPHDSAIAHGRKPSYLGVHSGLWSAKVIELRPIGSDSAEVVWSWRLWDHLVQDYDPAKPGYGVVADHPELYNLNYVNTGIIPDTAVDFIHLNQVTYNPTLDQVMISSHNTDEIWILDHSTTTDSAAMHTGGIHHKGGDFLYRWGNPAAYGRGTSSNNKLFQQHNPVWLTSGRYAGQIMIFNNGIARISYPVITSYSSVDIINPPVTSSGDYTLAAGMAYGPDTLSWTYSSTPVTSFYSAYEGGAQVLDNGNILICNALKGAFFEIDSDKNIVWRYINPVCNGVAIAQGATPANNTAYRCSFYPSSYAAFAAHPVGPGTMPLELSPSPYTCSVTTGVETLAGDVKSADVFPNPADASVVVSIENLSAIKLYDIMGRVVVSEHYNHVGHAAVSTASLPAGIYILCVNGRQYIRIAVQH